MNVAYKASPVKRRRATKSEMAERAKFLINYSGGARSRHRSRPLLPSRSPWHSRHRQDRSRRFNRLVATPARRDTLTRIPISRREIVLGGTVAAVFEPASASNRALAQVASPGKFGIVESDEEWRSELTSE